MSDIESIKRESNDLRGTIAQSLRDGLARFDEPDAQLIKFHGIYQQEDRDARQERKKAGLEPSYQFMLRTRVPGGVLTADQYLVHDTLADRFGNGSLRITTRQGLQMHGILKGNLRATIAEINASLLSTLAACGDVNRNVMACPAPPRNKAQEAVGELAQQLARHFTPKTHAYHEIWIDGETMETPHPAQEVEDPIYGRTYLPRKFKMGVAPPGDNCIDVYTQDIGFAAVVREGEVLGYTVLVGGGMGMTHGKTTTYPRAASPFCFVSPHDAIAVAEAIVTTQRDFGDRTNRKHARLKYLVEERGVAWLRAEVERRIGHCLPLPVDVAFNDACDHLGWLQQRDGDFALGVHIPSGRIKDTHGLRLRTALRAVIGLLRPGLRLTPQQNILLCGISAQDRHTVAGIFRANGVQTQPEALDISRYALACPALPTCGLALTDAERALPDIVSAIARELEKLCLEHERISIRMTGCPNGCARPYMGDVGFVGRSKDLYDMYLGGDWANMHLNWLYKSSVPRAQLVDELRPLLHAWKHERNMGETFGDYCSRVGRERLRELAEVSA